MFKKYFFSRSIFESNNIKKINKLFQYKEQNLLLFLKFIKIASSSDFI